MKNINNFRKIIKEICNELKIEYKFLSKDWIIMLSKNNVTKFISGYKFDLNNHGQGIVFDDKYAMYDVLDYINIPVIKHSIIYSSSNNNLYAKECNSLDYLKKIFNKYNKRIVLKVNNGTCGIGVYRILKENDLEGIYNKLILKNHSLSICPYYDIINEYRVIVLDNKIKLIYKKIRPKVFGDSKSTIKELLIDFNKDYFKDYNESNKDVILNNDEEFEYDWKFNLSRGAISSLDILEEDELKINIIVNNIIKNINIGFCSIDIIKTINNEFLVMEINSGVMMENFIKQNENGYNIAKDLYKEAIVKMFKEGEKK